MSFAFCGTISLASFEGWKKSNELVSAGSDRRWLACVSYVTAVREQYVDFKRYRKDTYSRPCFPCQINAEPPTALSSGPATGALPAAPNQEG